MRDIDFLRSQAAEHDPVLGQYASRLLLSPLPWTRMRQVRALLSLVQKYGARPVAQACSTALVYDMIDVRRLRRMLEQPKAKEAAAAPPRAAVIPIARYLRDPAQYSLPLTDQKNHNARKKEES
jgi:hypothetical protein